MVLVADSDWDHLVYGFWDIGRTGVSVSGLDDLSVSGYSKGVEEEFEIPGTEEPASLVRVFGTHRLKMESYREHYNEFLASPGKIVPFGVYVFNSGKEETTYAFEAFTENAWPVLLSLDQITLSPGQRTIIQILVDVPFSAEEDMREKVEIRASSESWISSDFIGGADFFVTVDSSLPTDSDQDNIADDQELQIGD